MINRVSSPQAAVSSPLVARDRAAGRPVAAGPDDHGAPPAPPDSGLSVEDLRQIAALQATDRQVRIHELAHMAAGAGLAGGATFTYQVGPDHQRYAVGGEVSIDTSPGNDPAATLAKAQRIRAAALAPADPSPQDQKVAAQAAQMASVARLELAAQDNAERRGETGQSSDPRLRAAVAAYQSVADGPGQTGFSAVA